MPGIYPRSSANALSPNSGHFPLIIVGFAIAVFILFGVAFWFGCQACQRRSRTKREERHGAAFLSVRGLVKDDEEEQHPTSFSRNDSSNAVVYPEKAHSRPPRPVRTDEDVLAYHRQSGTMPKPFAFALSANPASGPSDSRLSTMTGGFSHLFRTSIATSISSSNRYSVMSSNSSVPSSPTTGTMRTIRQMFTPVLPDELTPRMGESLKLVQSFEDGWCLVGRERERDVFATPTSSLFRSPNSSPADTMELGVVPAWSFLKPVKGLRAERPVRSSSLGITVEMEDTTSKSRHHSVMSWSNF